MAGRIENPSRETLYLLIVLPNADDVKSYKNIIAQGVLFDGAVTESPADESGISEIKGDGRMLDGSNAPIVIQGFRDGHCINLCAYHLSSEIAPDKGQRPLRGRFQQHFPDEFIGQVSSDPGVLAATRCLLIPTPRHNPADFLR